jgi:hypothetical protein
MVFLQLVVRDTRTEREADAAFACCFPRRQEESGSRPLLRCHEVRPIDLGFDKERSGVKKPTPPIR